jgi:TonB family protein
MHRDFLLACVLSILLHLGLLFGLPAPMWERSVAQDLPRDVELVAMTLPDPQALNAKTSLEPTPTPQPPPPPPSVPTFDHSRIAPISREQLEKVIEHASKEASMQLHMPTLELPAHQLSDTVAPPPPVNTSEVVAALLESSSEPPEQTPGKSSAAELGQLKLGQKQAPSHFEAPKAPKIDPQLLAPPPLKAAAPVTLPIPDPEPELGIQGPVAKREPLSQPPLPEVVVNTDSEITLKFWVRPDGVVSRIVTVRKDDTALEAAAIRYLAGWRFSPLLPHEPQEEQWGRMTVRFLRPTR